MKQTISKKVIAIALLFAFVTASLGLSACTAEPQEESKQISFAYTLTDQEVEEAFASIAQLEAYIDSGKNRKIVSAVDVMDEKLDYVDHQHGIGRISYYSDMDDETAYENYVHAEEQYLALDEERMRVLKKLYHSPLSAKDDVFADWNERELKKMETSSETVTALEQNQKNMVREYLELDDSDPEVWSEAVDEIYYRFVNSARQLAACYGYDSYYDYASWEVYVRKYTPQQRESFRSNVKEHILPFYLEVDAQLYEKYESLTKEQKMQLSALKYDVCRSDNKYLTGYMDSYPEELRSIMYNLFTRDAAVYTEKDTAHYAAYTSYSEYYDQPYVFFGNDLQDLLTVVHEMGHYASLYHFADKDLPYDTCEVHSQANEWLLLNYLGDQIDEDVYETFLLWRLGYGLSTIVDCTIIDEYEEIVYTQEEIASPDEFKQIMYQVLDGYENIDWVISYDDFYNYTQHVVLESPVYYLSYATSELVSMLFYTVAEEQGYESAQELYLNLCLKTPNDNLFFDTLMDVGLPNPFEVNTMHRLVEAFAGITDTAQFQQAA
jgi:hypothetical protein